MTTRPMLRYLIQVQGQAPCGCTVHTFSSLYNARGHSCRKRELLSQCCIQILRQGQPCILFFLRDAILPRQLFGYTLRPFTLRSEGGATGDSDSTGGAALLRDGRRSLCTFLQVLQASSIGHFQSLRSLLIKTQLRSSVRRRRLAARQGW